MARRGAPWSDRAGEEQAPASDTLRGWGRRIAAQLDEPRPGEGWPALPLALEGTTFQQRVWEALRAIPPGEVRTYAEVARSIGAPRAVRAVASACARNPVALLVPCHRVVAAGGMGGYGGRTDARGIWRKHWLLAHEGASCRGLKTRRPTPSDSKQHLIQRTSRV